MNAVFQGQDAVMKESCGSTPDNDVSVMERYAALFVLAAYTAEQKRRRKADGNGNDGRTVVVLVFVLMQSEPRAGLITVDEAGVRLEFPETCRACCSPGEL